MSYSYGKFKQLAMRLITKYGTTGTLNRATASTTGNEWEAPEITTQKYKCDAVIFGYTSFEINGVNILKDDRKILVPARSLDIVPCETDTVTIGEVEFSIVSVKTLAPSGDAITYELQVRTG